jgi:hypothetical protein
VTGTFIGTPADLYPVLDRLVATVGHAEDQRLVAPCGYVQAAAEPERWGSGTWGARVAFAAKSHIVRGRLSPAAANALAAWDQFTPPRTWRGAWVGCARYTRPSPRSAHNPYAVAVPRRRKTRHSQSGRCARASSVTGHLAECFPVPSGERHRARVYGAMPSGLTVRGYPTTEGEDRK